MLTICQNEDALTRAPAGDSDVPEGDSDVSDNGDLKKDNTEQEVDQTSSISVLFSMGLSAISSC